MSDARTELRDDIAEAIRSTNAGSLLDDPTQDYFPTLEMADAILTAIPRLVRDRMLGDLAEHQSYFEVHHPGDPGREVCIYTHGREFCADPELPADALADAVQAAWEAAR